jgi:hypothetical protein
VIKEKNCPFGIGYLLEAALFELPQRQRACTILEEGKANPGNNDVSGMGITTRIISQYLFGKGLPHSANQSQL